MGFFDAIISIGIIVAFALLIWSKVYEHEKDSLRPLIKKIKGWFHKDDDGGSFDPNEDFELAFRGNS